MGESLGSRLLPDIKTGKASGVFGIIAAIFALMRVYELNNGGPPPQNPSLYMIFIPIWLLILSSYFIGFGQTKNKNLGRMIGLVVFIASLLGFLATFYAFASISVVAELWTMFVILFDLEYILMGAALLLVGLLLLKIGKDASEKKGTIIITAITYLAIGVFGILAVTLVFQVPSYAFTMYPWVSGSVILPSLFSLAL